MFLPFINGCAPYPCALADDKGRRAVILHSQNARQVEDHMRLVSMDMGSAAGLAIAPVSAGDVKKYSVMRFVTQSVSLCTTKKVCEARDLSLDDPRGFFFLLVCLVVVL